MARVINISVDDQTDNDILLWLEQQPNKSAAIRLAIRAYMAKQDGPTLADILAEIRSLPSRFTVSTPPEGEAMAETELEEPAEAAVNLDGLLSRLGQDGSVGI
jgi:hypothetical protein